MLKKSLKDAYCIVRARPPARSRLRLLLALLRTFMGGKGLLGWKIQYVCRDNLRLLFSEIFARQNYYVEGLKRDPTILDCGANIGMATLYFKWLYPETHISPFDPYPATFKILEQNISGNNLSSVAVHNVALAAVDGEIPFHVPQPGSLMMSAVLSRGGGQTISVPARPLSIFIEGEVDLLKLDIEGMEGPVLEELAASGKLFNIRQAIIEVHHNLPEAPHNLSSVLHILESAGFRYNVIDAYPRSGQCGTVQDVMIRAKREASQTNHQ